MLHLNRDECRHLLDQCAPDLRDFVLGALYTGARASEIANMRVGDFNREIGAIYIPPGKTNKHRHVYLPDEGYAFFEKLCESRPASDHMFKRTSGNRWYTNYRHAFKLAVINAGLPKAFCSHGLRHTYASQLVQSGTPTIVVSQQLGHVSTTQVSRTYGHLAPQIRESEVRQRFLPITSEGGAPLNTTRPTYAIINDVTFSPGE